jgi:hypothetical protein
MVGFLINFHLLWREIINLPSDLPEDVARIEHVHVEGRIGHAEIDIAPERTTIRKPVLVLVKRVRLGDLAGLNCAAVRLAEEGDASARDSACLPQGAQEMVRPA